MVTTRSQSNRNDQTETQDMDRSSDSESDASFPEVLSRDQIENLDSEDVLTRHHGNHNNSVDQRFNELNRQIGDLTSIVLTLTNQIASINGEGNRRNVATTSANSRSDTGYLTPTLNLINLTKIFQVVRKNDLVVKQENRCRIKHGDSST